MKKFLVLTLALVGVLSLATSCNDEPESCGIPENDGVLKDEVDAPFFNGISETTVNALTSGTTDATITYGGQYWCKPRYTNITDENRGFHWWTKAQPATAPAVFVISGKYYGDLWTLASYYYANLTDVAETLTAYNKAIAGLKTQWTTSKLESSKTVMPLLSKSSFTLADLPNASIQATELEIVDLTDNTMVGQTYQNGIWTYYNYYTVALQSEKLANSYNLFDDAPSGLQYACEKMLEYWSTNTTKQNTINGYMQTLGLK